MIKKLKNALLAAAVKIFRFFITPSSPDKHCRPFLVVSTTALGDTIWALPSLEALKQKYPSSDISVLTSPQGKQVIEASRINVDIFTLRKPHFLSLLSLFYKLRKKHFSAIFLFHTSQRMILPFCALLNSKMIIGSVNNIKGPSSLLTHAVESNQEHEIEHRLKIVAASIKEQKKRFLHLSPSPFHQKKAASLLREWHWQDSKPIIAMHPGSTDLFKRWPKQNFIALGKKIQKHLPCHILITCTEAERPLAEEIACNLDGAIALPTKMDIASFSALLKSCSLMISNDTGPMHVAAAVATPLIALFAGTNSHLCGPRGAGPIVVIQKGVTCTPCLKKKCLEPICMWQIGVDEVFQQAVHLLQLSRRTP